MELIDILLILCIVILIGIIILILVHNTKRFRRLQNDYSDYKKLKYNEIYQKEKNNLDIDLELLSKEIQHKRKELDEIEGYNTKVKRIQDAELAERIKTKEAAALAQLDNDIKEWAKSAQEAENTKYLQLKDYYYNLTEELYDTYHKILAQVNEIQAQRNALNEEILRAREMEEQQDFYRIQLEDSAKSDINFLLSIVDRFYNKETIYKIIWSEYLQKPFKKMLNNVLGNKEPKNVIYMIQNLKTKEIYIGKTKAEVSKRWTEHIKTSLNIGTISRTLIHKALFNNWDNFTFSILEEVSSSADLNAKEKYYISFYKSDIYGYNIKSGG